MPIKIVNRSNKKMIKPTLEHMDMEVAKKVLRFHQTFPEYKKTPFRDLTSLAKELGVGHIFVKDESHRFGLSAFKVLGGSYAIGQFIAEKLGESIDDLSFERITSLEVKEKLGELTFISATDGNHGRGIAWTANLLQQKCIIYMPKGSAKERFENIRNEGAIVKITDLNYDDTVRLAERHAAENGWVLIQDTSWPGYETIPTHIIQGYMTLAYEIYQQLDGIIPTHVFLQAGVGAFATAVTSLFVSVFGENKPKIIIVEPKEAACVYKTMKIDDGKPHTVVGDLKTIMAGLACGEPVTVGIDILRYYGDYFLACDDYVAAQGMRVLSSPIGKDERIVSGESGAAGLGAAYEILTNPELKEFKEIIGINEQSSLVFVNTEGDTDQENYKKIVWGGYYQRPQEN